MQALVSDLRTLWHKLNPFDIEKLQGFLAGCEVLGITLGTAQHYARVRRQLKGEGRPIPENDVWIAASCLEHQLPLATQDAHFNGLAGLTVLQW